MQHHPYLAPGDGGTGILHAPALVEAFALGGLLAPTHIVLFASSLMPAPHHLKTFQSQCHAPGARVEDGGEREHGEAVRQLQGGDDGLRVGDKVVEELLWKKSVVSIVKIFCNFIVHSVCIGISPFQDLVFDFLNGNINRESK